jgi:hypothetical protein
MQVSAARLLLLTGAASAAAFGLFFVWLRSPLPLAVLGAIGFGSIFMLVVASLGDDPVAADDAWRQEAKALASDLDSDLDSDLASDSGRGASDAERTDRDP